MEDKELVVTHLSQRLQLILAKVTELTEQKEELERQIASLKVLFKHYRAVYEAEQLVGAEGKLIVETIRAIEEKLGKERGLEVASGDTPTSVAEAVAEILALGQPLHAKIIAEKVVKKYPDIQIRIKNLPKQVVAVLVRGYQIGKYDRVGPNTYKVRKKGR